MTMILGQSPKQEPKKGYSLLPNEQTGGVTLQKNGVTMICPFMNRLVLPGTTVGGVNILPGACNDACPLFAVGNQVVTLSCGGSKTEIVIGEITVKA